MSHCAPGTRSRFWYARIVPSVRLATRISWATVCFVVALHVMLPMTQAQSMQQQAKRNAIEAIPLLTANAADHPRSASALFELGRAYQTAGDREEAQWRYEQALALDGGHADALEALE